MRTKPTLGIGQQKKQRLLQISEIERLEIKNTRLPHFANARNMVPRYMVLLDFGNPLNIMQLCAISKLIGT